MIEPGRFISAPAGKLHTKILAIHDKTIIVNASVYNSDMDALIVDDIGRIVLVQVDAIVDFKNNVEFILSVTLYTNENQTFNDDDYEYAEIGQPFLTDLGQAIYEIELKRQREFKPDLSRFQVTYKE